MGNFLPTEGRPAQGLCLEGGGEKEKGANSFKRRQSHNSHAHQCGNNIAVEDELNIHPDEESVKKSNSFNVGFQLVQKRKQN